MARKLVYRMLRHGHEYHEYVDKGTAHYEKAEGTEGPF